MAHKEPVTEIDTRFGDPHATATEWADAVAMLTKAEVFWLTTLRPDGRRPHVTPLLAVWSEGSLFFCTGAGEQKTKNLEANPEVVLTTGTNTLGGGCDLVVEGQATRMRDEARLRELALEWERKYGDTWRYGVEDGAFVGGKRNVAPVYEVRPRKALGFGKGPYSQTSWVF